MAGQDIADFNIFGVTIPGGVFGAARDVLVEKENTRQQIAVTQGGANVALAKAQEFFAQNQKALYIGAGLLLVIVALKMAKVV